MARSDRPATQAPDPAAAVSGTGGAAPLGRTVFASSAAPPVQILTTQPAQLLRHIISDEELEMLGATNRDGLSEHCGALWGPLLRYCRQWRKRYGKLILRRRPQGSPSYIFSKWRHSLGRVLPRSRFGSSAPVVASALKESSPIFEVGSHSKAFF